MVEIDCGGEDVPTPNKSAKKAILTKMGSEICTTLTHLLISWKIYFVQ